MSIRYPVLGFETAIFWNESPPVTTRQGSHNQCGVCMYLIAKRVDMIERVNKICKRAKDEWDSCLWPVQLSLIMLSDVFTISIIG